MGDMRNYIKENKINSTHIKEEQVNIYFIYLSDMDLDCSNLCGY